MPKIEKVAVIDSNLSVNCLFDSGIFDTYPAKVEEVFANFLTLLLNARVGRGKLKTGKFTLSVKSNSVQLSVDSQNPVFTIGSTKNAYGAALEFLRDKKTKAYIERYWAT